MLRKAITLSPVLALLFAASAFAVEPSEWVHRTESDFSEGEREGVVVTNLGKIRLAQQTDMIASLADDAIIYDVAQLDDGRIFLAIGPEGRLGELVDESIETIAEFDGSQVFSLATDGDSLYVGVSGATSHIEQRSGEDMAATRTVELPETRYVWKVLLANDRVYAATGTEGRVFSVDLAEDEPEIVTALDSQPNNVLTLASDGNGHVYAGTDTEGLVYRLTREGDGYTPFVIYDAPEPEIGALLVTEDGTVYAGTADANQARTGRLEAARDEATGRPDDVQDAADDDADAEDAPEGDEEVPDQPEPDPQDAAEDDADEADAEEEADDDAEQADTPSPEQYDQLREIVSDRIATARESGRVPTQTSPSPSPRTNNNNSSARSTGRSTTSARGGSQQGNAIYRISPDGFVHEIFRDSVMILDILQQNGALLVATGNEGQIYRVNPESEEVAILADLDSQQIPALFKTADDDVLLGTANPGLLYELGTGFADRGTYLSPTLDAEQVSLWGTLHVKAANREGTTIQVRTRSGNVADPDLGTWSPWSQPQAIELVGGQSAYLEVPSPSARFVQYQLTLESADGASPTVYQVAMRYLMPNLAPRISSLTTSYGQGNNNRNNNSGPQPQHTMTVEWEAEDRNNDALRYTLEARTFGTDDPYVTVAEDIEGSNYEWDTRSLPDGRYVLRLTASDAPDNVDGQAMTSRRRSDPVTVDNTSPEVENVDVQVNDDGQVTVTAEVIDALVPIREVRYRVSGGEDEWKLVLPDDQIYDSTAESVEVTIDGLAPGTRVLSLRVTDVQGNTRYVSRTFSVPR